MKTMKNKISLIATTLTVVLVVTGCSRIQNMSCYGSFEELRTYLYNNEFSKIDPYLLESLNVNCNR